MKKLLIGLAALVLAASSSSALASSILVSESPWGQDMDVNNFNDVFGVSNYTFIGSYSAATPGAIFTGSNSFVMLEGGDGTDGDFANYVNSNAATILSWVSGGGSLLLQSASWDRGPLTLGPGTISGPAAYESYCGTLTAAGTAAFTFTSTPASQCGNYLSHDEVSGTGLTAYMLDDYAGPNIAGTAYGSGFILYSGLTDSEYHYSGQGLVDDEIAFAASNGKVSAVPEPGSLTLLCSGLLGLAGFVRRTRHG